MTIPLPGIGFLSGFHVAEALAAISLVFVGRYWLPILVISSVGGMVVCLYRAMDELAHVQRYHFERMLMLYGVSTGTLSHGLALLRVMDPEFRPSIFRLHALGRDLPSSWPFPSF
jgi:ESS family glutamate:Na+ symporter